MNKDIELDKLRILVNVLETVEQEEDEPETDPSTINTAFGDGFDAEAFMKMPLPDRFPATHVKTPQEISREKHRTSRPKNPLSNSSD